MVARPVTPIVQIRVIVFHTGSHCVRSVSKYFTHICSAPSIVCCMTGCDLYSSKVWKMGSINYSCIIRILYGIVSKIASGLEYRI